MRRLRVMAVVGARPNFMKIAPLMRQMEARPEVFEPFLVHTGQHYDEAMSDSFFKTLRISEPKAHLAVGSGTHAEQVGRTMIAFEKVLREWRPDWVVVVGDVNATCACSITAAKEHVKVAHIEAGLRSFDRTMPEEINRIVTDQLSDLLFTTDEIADRNLRNEGIPEEKIKRVGNIMIDTLEEHREAAGRMDLGAIVRGNLVTGGGSGGKAQREESAAKEERLPTEHTEYADREAKKNVHVAPITDGGYAVLTLHRPSNVDDPEVLSRLVDLFAGELSKVLPFVWTIHPRTRKSLEAAGLWNRVASSPGIVLLEPVNYLEMLRLNMGARIMLTDSGGLQEECCVLGTPCITLRPNTERPITLRSHGGTCELAGNDTERIRGLFHELCPIGRHPFRPDLWDGRVGERIAKRLVSVDVQTVRDS